MTSIQLEKILASVIAILFIYVAITGVFFYMQSLKTLEDAPQATYGELTDYRHGSFGSHHYRVKINGSNVGHVIVPKRLDGNVVLVVKPN